MLATIIMQAAKPNLSAQKKDVYPNLLLVFRRKHMVMVSSCAVV